MRPNQTTSNQETQNQAPQSQVIANKGLNKFYLIWAIIITAFVAYFAFVHFKGGAAGAFAQGGGGAVPVGAIKLASQSVDDFEELPGRTAAYEYAEVRPQADGIILKIFFTEGKEVKKGQQLYQIDSAQYEATYNTAKADLQKAEANLKTIKAKSGRYETLTETDAISKQEYDDLAASLAVAKADVAIAKAAVDKAKIYLNYAKVLAPISGFTSKSLIRTGQLVSANQPDAMTTITQLDPIFVDIARSSEDLERFKSQIANKEKVEVELYLNDGSVYEHKGVLQFSEVNVDPSTSAVQLRALFENPKHVLLPGSFVKVKIKTSSHNAILVSQKNAMRGPNGNLAVWVVDDKNVVNPRPIKAAKAINNQWLVTEGLKDGDVILTDGFHKVAPGATVAPTIAASPIVPAATVPVTAAEVKPASAEPSKETNK